MIIIYIFNKNKGNYLSLQKRKTLYFDIMGRKPKVKYDPVRDTMILIEYARNPKPSAIARQYNVHHSYVTRLWESLSEDARKGYAMKAEDVQDIAAEQIVAEQSDAITRINKRLIELVTISIEEYGKRITGYQKVDVKNQDIIAFMRAAMQVVQGATKTKSDDAEQKEQPISQMFQLIDNSVQQNIQLNQYDYDE